MKCKQNNILVDSLYTEWSLGECNGDCGTGSRTDVRECVGENCGEELSRTVNCTLPNPCEQECKKLSLDCSEHASCVKQAKSLKFVCECLDGFTGNGTVCVSNGSFRFKTNLVVFGLVITMKSYLRV